MSLFSALESLQVPQQLCAVLRQTPYRLLDEAEKPLEDGGVLAAGTRVWTANVPSAVRRTRVVQAYVDGVGRVLIDGKLLKRVQA